MNRSTSLTMKHVVLYHRHTIVDTRPGCLHGALALALVILALIGGYAILSLGLPAQACNIGMLALTVGALGYVLTTEARRWADNLI